MVERGITDTPKLVSVTQSFASRNFLEETLEENEFGNPLMGSVQLKLAGTEVREVMSK